MRTLPFSVSNEIRTNGRVEHEARSCGADRQSDRLGQLDRQRVAVAHDDENGAVGSLVHACVVVERQRTLLRAPSS